MGDFEKEHWGLDYYPPRCRAAALNAAVGIPTSQVYKQVQFCCSTYSGTPKSKSDGCRLLGLGQRPLSGTNCSRFAEQYTGSRIP
eukprot:2349881-Rhodomonas_salina.2